MGLASRRRYRWTVGRISDYWDEVFTADGFDGHAAALDDQSAFIASLGTSRSPRMRDVLGTIQADQDAIIRAGSRGALVVDGGPGTGKTVVALHRTAYLLYADPRLGHRRGGVLFVGPHQPYLAYVSDVLPSLGEEGVQTCTLRDLRPRGRGGGDETDPVVARLKSTVEMVKAIEPAVRFYEEPPAKGMEVETPWSDIWLSADDWAEAFESPDPGTPHNEARDQVWEELLTILADKHDDDEDASRRPAPHGRWCATRELARGLQQGVAADRGDRPRRRPVVGAGVPAPVRALARPRRGPRGCSARTPRPGRCPTCRSWTRPGNGSATPRRRDAGGARRPRVAAEREEMASVVDHLIATDDSDDAR